MNGTHISSFVLDGEPVVLAYDLVGERLIPELSDYAVHLVDKGRSYETVVQEVRHLALFWEFLRLQPHKLHEVDDEIVRVFRDAELEVTKAKSSSRGKDDLAKATVNAKLRRVYHWLHWLQLHERLPAGHVGERGKVTSSVASPAVQKHHSGRRRLSESFSCPLLFNVRGGKSKHHLSKHVPSEQTVDELHTYFFSQTTSGFIAERNCLFVDIVSRLGMRRGSVNSLLQDQFREEDIDKASDEFWVVPNKQKFGYSFSFPVPLDLARNINRFIEQILKPVLKQSAIPESVHQGHLFLSARDFRPMANRSITQVISRAMRELGFPKGVGPHSFRWKFAGENLAEQVDRRREMGLDTSARTIAAETSMLMGQMDPASLYPYALASLSKTARKGRDDTRRRLEALQAENAALRAELQQLKEGEF
jgi:hypothetical protein